MEFIKRQRIALQISSTLLLMEGIAILLTGIGLVIKTVISGVSDVWALVGLILFSLVGGAGLLLSAKGVRTNKRYGRAPAILSNLIALGVCKYMFEGHLWWAAIPIALIATSVVIFTLVGMTQTNKKD